MNTEEQPAPQEVEAPKPEIEEEDDIPMPTSSAPPPPYSTPGSSGGVPMRSARFRRGSRGGARPSSGRAPPAIPQIRLVEIDPHFRPPAHVLPPQPSSPAPTSTAT